MGRGLFILILSIGFYLSIFSLGGLSIVSVSEAARTVDWIQGSLQSIIVNQPITVTISAYVEPDPALIPTSVNLIRYDSNGNVVANLGRLYDDGTHGDAVAGDNIFTSQISFNEPAQTTIFLRASVAYRGLLKRIFSQTLSIPVYGDGTAVIGPDGGVVEVNNPSNPLYGFRLEVPPGAVSQEVTITVNNIPCGDVNPILDGRWLTSHKKNCLAAFSAKPDGLVFSSPITAKVPILPLTPGWFPLQIEVDLDKQTYWRVPGEISYLPQENAIQINIAHFSEMAVVEAHKIQNTSPPSEGVCRTCKGFTDNLALCESYATDPYQKPCCLMDIGERLNCPGYQGCYGPRMCCKELGYTAVTSCDDRSTSQDNCQVVCCTYTINFPFCPAGASSTKTECDGTPTCNHPSPPSGYLLKWMGGNYQDYTTTSYTGNQGYFTESSNLDSFFGGIAVFDSNRNLQFVTVGGNFDLVINDYWNYPVAGWWVNDIATHHWVVTGPGSNHYMPIIEAGNSSFRDPFVGGGGYRPPTSGYFEAQGICSPGVTGFCGQDIITPQVDEPLPFDVIGGDLQCNGSTCIKDTEVTYANDNRSIYWTVELDILPP